MDKTTLADPAVKPALAGYVKIKFQAEDPDDPRVAKVMQYMKTSTGLPTYVIMKPKAAAVTGRRLHDPPAASHALLQVFNSPGLWLSKSSTLQLLIHQLSNSPTHQLLNAPVFRNDLSTSHASTASSRVLFDTSTWPPSAWVAKTMRRVGRFMMGRWRSRRTGGGAGCGRH